MAEKQEILELNTAMMRNTFKIEGKGSVGSCFLIGKPLKKDQSRAKFILVTAAHVFEQIEGEQATLYLRKEINDNNFVKTPWVINIRQGDKILWVKHKSGIDVAAIYVRLPKDADHYLLPINVLANDDILTRFEIHPGDEMFCLGYPFGTEANEAGFPILRSGKVASFPLVPTQKNESFLLDFKIFKGNSGGPVYFAGSNRTYGGITHIGENIHFIAGLVSQEFTVTETIRSLYETKQQTYPLSLSIIIHASHILETINLLPDSEED